MSKNDCSSAPCPWCRKTAGRYDRFDHAVYCGACGASGPVILTEHEAIAAWNAASAPCVRTLRHVAMQLRGAAARHEADGYFAEAESLGNWAIEFDAQANREEASNATR